MDSYIDSNIESYIDCNIESYIDSNIESYIDSNIESYIDSVLSVSTYRIKGKRLVNQAIGSSLEFGYRLFDTGAHYDNQRELGVAFKENLPQQGLRREDIYIISKLGKLGRFLLLTPV